MSILDFQSKTSINVCILPLLLVWISAFFLASVIFAGSAKADNNQQSAEATEITAGEMTFLRRENKIEFLQDVYLKRPDMELWSDKLFVFLDPEVELAGEDEQEGGVADAREFKRLEAQGQVRIEMENRQATSHWAVYERDQEVLVLQGDVEISEGPNIIQGETVTIYLQEERSEVSAKDEERVRAVFFPENEGESGAQ